MNVRTNRIKFYELLLSSHFSKVLEGFRSLSGSPNELHKAYTLKFLDSYAYFSLSIIFTLFLSSDFGYTDIEAGTIYGAWGALITIYGLVAGVIVDNIGVAKSLRLGFSLSLVSRCLIFLTTSRAMLLLNVCGLLPMGNCLGIPVLTTGIRRYTNESNRGFAFGLFYVIMNVAALLSGPIVDFCTILYDQNDGSDQATTAVTSTVDDEKWSLTGYRLVVLTGIVANAIGVIVSFTVREISIVNHQKVTWSSQQENQESGLRVTSANADADKSEGGGLSSDAGKANSTIAATTRAKEAAASSSLFQQQKHHLSATDNNGDVFEFVPLKGSALSILKETINSKSFWRFLLVCMITVNIRMIFRHLDATLPKYMVREFGHNVAKGTIYSINPAIIIILVPLITAATSHVDPLLMIHHGAYISAASVFFLVLSTSIWSCVLFVTVLSIGEAVWSPRLYDYTMSVTKEGREGTYMALSSAPLFLAKLPVGFMSGKLLQKFCPEEGPRNSKMMWLVIGLTTAISPILLTVCWNYVSKKDCDDDDVIYTELQQTTLSQFGKSETEETSSNGIEPKNCPPPQSCLALS